MALLALVMAPGPEPSAIDEVAIFLDFRKPLTPLATVFLALWEFQSLDEVKTLVYMEIYILSRMLSLEELFI